jgi:hypothetical protein
MDNDMEIKFENGSTIKALNTFAETTRSATKSLEQMKWIMGDLYKSLKWYQKVWLRIDYRATTIIDWIIFKICPASYYLKYYR